MKLKRYDKTKSPACGEAKHKNKMGQQKEFVKDPERLFGFRMQQSKERITARSVDEFIEKLRNSEKIKGAGSVSIVAQMDYVVWTDLD